VFEGLNSLIRIKWGMKIRSQGFVSTSYFIFEILLGHLLKFGYVGFALWKDRKHQWFVDTLFETAVEDTGLLHKRSPSTSSRCKTPSASSP
jgi:hypothetical protein